MGSELRQKHLQLKRNFVILGIDNVKWNHLLFVAIKWLAFAQLHPSTPVGQNKIKKWKGLWRFLDDRNGILLPKLFWPTVRKHCSSDWEKLLKIKAEGQEFSKILITGTIYWNSERSEQFLVTDYFFNLFLEVSHI